ncbi:MAG: cysteine hydrolase [Actinomycetota bacterium]|nr:cysteine hydrolase [Actinomycetota bacterium]
MAGELDVARAALLLMDFQNYGAHPNGYWAKRDPSFFARLATSGVLVRAACALQAARSSGMRVVHVANRWRPGHIDMHEGMPVWAGRKGTDVAVEGTWGAEIVEELAPTPGEPVVVKRSVDAFAGTELSRLLTLYGTDTLVLAGVATNFVVEGTAREAADLGYRVVVLSDACETVNDEWQRFSLEIMSLLGKVISVDEFVADLGD